MIQINGVTIKSPKTMNATVSDIDGETTRNALGNLIRDRITVKKKLELTFPPMTQTEISTLLNAVKNVFFSVTYLDPQDGVITITMYVGDRTAPMFKYGSGGSDVMWEGLSMNFIQQ